jgi:tetratricopeptide (TPR) repeat protein
MQTTARNSLALIDFFSLKRVAETQTEISYGGLYQQLAALGFVRRAYTKEVFHELGNVLINVAEHAYALRQMEVLEQASQILINAPLPHQYESIGHYYYALCKLRQGRFDEAQALFGQVVEEAPLQYRARAMLSIGGMFFLKGDSQSALPFYVDATRAASYSDRNFLISTIAQRSIAILKGVDGNHRGALADLESLFPLVRAIGFWYPSEFYNYLNSFAIELGESGRLEEAQNVCKIVLASPLLCSYPEWRETSDEVALKGYRASRSLIAVNQRVPKSENVLSLPIREHSDGIGPTKPIRPFLHQGAGVTFIQDWKSNMAKKRNGDKKDNKPSEELDDREMLLKIVQISTQKGLPDEALMEMVDALEKIAAKYTKKDGDKND